MAIAQIRLWSFAQECDEIGKRITYVNLDKRAGVSKGWEEELFGLLKSYNISYLPFVLMQGMQSCWSWQKMTSKQRL